MIRWGFGKTLNKKGICGYDIVILNIWSYLLDFSIVGSASMATPIKSLPKNLISLLLYIWTIF